MRIAVFIVSLFISFSSHAAGIYAGIWQSLEWGDYVFISENSAGNFIIATTYNNIPATNIYVPFNNGQTYRIASLDVGDLLSGPVVGTYAELTGIAAFRACNNTIGVTFTSATTAVVQFLDSWPTAAGTAQGINCAQIRNNAVLIYGSTIHYVKVF